MSHYTLNGELDPWPSKREMERLLRAAGLRIYVGEYSIRIEDVGHFSFQHYGGDICDPSIEADDDSLDRLRHVAQTVSSTLAASNIRHRFEIYSDDQDTLLTYLHHNWPPG